jgi:DNA-directed RNA polymerase beta' subunit
VIFSKNNVQLHATSHAVAWVQGRWDFVRKQYAGDALVESVTISMLGTTTILAFHVQVLSGRRVYDILKGISDEDCRILGLDPRYARPDWMMITVMPVPPPHVRPAIEMDSTGRCEDDLTHHLASIIRDNQALRHHMSAGSPEHVLKVCVLAEY